MAAPDGVPSDFGHVAADFATPLHFNTLVLRPQYRITLRMGEIEDLFPHAANTVEGRMERLQVLGLFYFPLYYGSKKRVPLNYDGVKSHFTPCWWWVKTRIFKVKSDKEADDVVRSALRKRVVGMAFGSFADLGKRAVLSGLPEAARNPEKPSLVNFARIRVPGGYACMCSSRCVLSMDRVDASYRADFHFDKSRLFKAESRVWRDNPFLGKIPLVARVERREGTGEWKPARDVAVYFQLVKPYALPVYNRNKPIDRQVAAIPCENALLKSNLQTREAWPPASPADPQGKNCHHTRGGLRGKGNAAKGEDVADVIFAVTPVPGFNGAHDPARPLSHKAYETAVPTGSKFAHSVSAKTNEEGEAGVVFMPSRTGGDTYRVRAFVGPPTISSDGQGFDATRVETGTLVVWRNIRISRYIHKKVEKNKFDERLLDGAAPYFPGMTPISAASTAAERAAARTQYLRRTRLVDDKDVWAPLPFIDFRRFKTYFARAYCEVEYDGRVGRKGKMVPTIINRDEYARAYEYAIMDATRYEKKYNLRRLLLPVEEAYPPEAIALLPTRSPEAYNALCAAGDRKILLDSAHRATSTPDKANEQYYLVQELVKSYLVPGFFRVLAKSGALPGFTILHTAAHTSLNTLFGDNYGILDPARGFILDMGGHGHRNEPGKWLVHQTAAHELGHAMFLYHAQGSGTNLLEKKAHGAVPEDHDPANLRCLMSYLNSPVEFCSKCLLALRGWKIYS